MRALKKVMKIVKVKTLLKIRKNLLPKNLKTTKFRMRRVMMGTVMKQKEKNYNTGPSSSNQKFQSQMIMMKSTCNCFCLKKING